MKINELCENPDNPSKCTDEQLERLAGKLKRVPLGLTAMRIAYVTDKIPNKKMVISGNKRLRVLKKAYGEDAELPDEWFQDVTQMSEAERHEFIVTANVSDGDWDIDKLLEQYDTTELSELMNEVDLVKLLDIVKDNELEEQKNVEDQKKNEEDVNIYSEEGKSYKLGANIIICKEAVSCDEIRKLYVVSRIGCEDNWQNETPEYYEDENA